MKNNTKSNIKSEHYLTDSESGDEINNRAKATNEEALNLDMQYPEIELEGPVLTNALYYPEIEFEEPAFTDTLYYPEIEFEEPAFINPEFHPDVESREPELTDEQENNNNNNVVQNNELSQTQGNEKRPRYNRLATNHPILDPGNEIKELSNLDIPAVFFNSGKDIPENIKVTWTKRAKSDKRYLIGFIQIADQKYIVMPLAMWNKYRSWHTKDGKELDRSEYDRVIMIGQNFYLKEEKDDQIDLIPLVYKYSLKNKKSSPNNSDPHIKFVHTLDTPLTFKVPKKLPKDTIVYATSGLPVPSGYQVKWEQRKDKTQSNIGYVTKEENGVTLKAKVTYPAAYHREHKLVFARTKVPVSPEACIQIDLESPMFIDGEEVITMGAWKKRQKRAKKKGINLEIDNISNIMIENNNNVETAQESTIDNPKPKRKRKEKPASTKKAKTTKTHSNDHPELIGDNNQSETSCSSDFPYDKYVYFKDLSLDHPLLDPKNEIKELANQNIPAVFYEDGKDTPPNIKVIWTRRLPSDPRYLMGFVEIDQSKYVVIPLEMWEKYRCWYTKEGRKLDRSEYDALVRQGNKFFLKEVKADQSIELIPLVHCLNFIQQNHEKERIDRSIQLLHLLNTPTPLDFNVPRRLSKNTICINIKLVHALDTPRDFNAPKYLTQDTIVYATLGLPVPSGYKVEWEPRQGGKKSHVGYVTKEENGVTLKAKVTYLKAYRQNFKLVFASNKIAVPPEDCFKLDLKSPTHYVNGEKVITIGAWEWERRKAKTKKNANAREPLTISNTQAQPTNDPFAQPLTGTQVTYVANEPYSPADLEATEERLERTNPSLYSGSMAELFVQPNANMNNNEIQATVTPNIPQK